MSFKTLVNFRDLSEYTMKDGKKIAPHRLLRSGELCQLCENDVQLLTDTYQLKEIVDFRSEKEVIEKPDDTITNATYHNIDMFKGDEHEAPALAEIKKNRDTLSADERMLLVYEHLILSPISQKGFKQFFDLVLKTTQGAIVWHCFAGKDRTGIAAALLLHVLGASEETIYEDYLKTIEGRKAANDKILSKMKSEGADEQQLEDSHVMLTVRKGYLDYALQLINERFENVDHYIEHVIGVSAEEQAQLRHMYLINGAQ